MEPDEREAIRRFLEKKSKPIGKSNLSQVETVAKPQTPSASTQQPDVASKMPGYKPSS